MATLASTLLDFILGLLGDDEKAEAFADDPEGTLAAAGLDDLCLADFPNVMNLLQYTPGLASTSSVVPGTTAAPAAPVAGGALPPTAATVLPGTVVSPVSRGETEEEGVEDGVIEQLQYIQRTYTYNATTNVEVRDNVWAGQDVYALFGDDSVLAAPGGFAVRGGIEDAEIAFEFEDSFNPVAVDGDGNAVGKDNEVENTDNSTNVKDSNGTVIGDGQINGDAVSGIGNVVGNDVDLNSGNTNTNTNSNNDTRTDNSDNSTNLNVSDSGNDNSDNSSDDDIIDSGNDNSDNSSDDDIIDSGNDFSTSDDDELEFEVGDVSVATGPGSAAGDDATVANEDNDDFTTVTDNIVVTDNEVELEENTF